MKWKEFFQRYVEVRVCPGCRELIDFAHAEEAFCPACRQIFDRAKTESCPACFQAYCECTCMPKSLQSVGALSLRKLVRYSSKRQKEPQNRIIYALKHRPNRRCSAFLARELYPLIREEVTTLAEEDTDRVRLVFIPRSRQSLVKYGTDQSEAICKELSLMSGIPMVSAFHRKRGGKEQKKLGVAARRKNLRGLFSVEKKEEIQGRVILLLDDVVTTGASMATCAHLLKQAGAAAVLCVCLAKND